MRKLVYVSTKNKHQTNNVNYQTANHILWLTLSMTGQGLYLSEVQLSDFATDIFSQATGKRDHACQLAGISTDQLKIGPVGQTEDMSHRQWQFDLKTNI